MIDFDHIGDSIEQLLSESGYHHFADIDSLADALSHCGIDVSALSDAQLESLFSDLSDLSQAAVEGGELDPENLSQLLAKLPESLIKFGSASATCGNYNLY